MKKLIIIFLFSAGATFSQNVSPEFSELKGMEDMQGNTHLFYRIYTYFANDPIYQWTNHIYHLNKTAEIDTLFITASGMESPTYNHSKWVGDVDFWNNNPDYFIYSGGQTSGPFFEGSAYVQRFDGFYSSFGYFWGSANYIDISHSNDSLLFLGAILDDGFKVYKSIDGGINWDSLSISYQFLSLNPYYGNIYFVEDEDRKLFRTTDTGSTFNLVDSDFLPDTRFYYDPNSQYVYRKAYHKLIVSDNLGEQFSWQTVFTNSTTDPFYFSNDISVSGSIFISEGKNIFHSLDFGNSFNLYKSLEQKIVGIYKKPNSDKLYAATKYKIFEITPDTIQVIKNLPIPEEVFAWYPLNLGDKWVYDKTFYVDSDSLNWVSIIEVETNEIFENSVYAKVLVTDIGLDSLSQSGNHYEYFRTDSSNGRVYQAGIENDSLLYEELYMDLIVEVGDTIPVGNGIYLESEEPVTIFGLNSRKRIFKQTQTPIQQLELVNGLGKIYEYIWELAGSKIVLNGCIINGIVYGDTTVVSVENETPNLPTEFSLSQNYPNPFNPGTIISWQSPVGSWQTLKVYDVLGNEVVTLVDEYKPAGSYEVEFNPGSGIRNLASGIYFYQLRAGSFIQTKKMIFLK